MLGHLEAYTRVDISRKQLEDVRSQLSFHRNEEPHLLIFVSRERSEDVDWHGLVVGNPLAITGVVRDEIAPYIDRRIVFRRARIQFRVVTVA